MHLMPAMPLHRMTLQSRLSDIAMHRSHRFSDTDRPIQMTHRMGRTPAIRAMPPTQAIFSLMTRPRARHRSRPRLAAVIG